MGTSYVFDGRIEITPPLNFAQSKQARKDAYILMLSIYGGKAPKWISDISAANSDKFDMKDHLPLDLEMVESEQDTDDGVMRIYRCPGLTYSYAEGSFGRSSMAAQVNRLIKLFPDHAFEGEMIAVEANGRDAVKLVVKDGVAVDIDGTSFIRFEDGSEAKISDLL